MTLAIGLDVGGSKTAACLFDVGRGTVVSSVRTATNTLLGGPAVLEDCVTAIDVLLADAGVDPTTVPVGIGVCELVGLDGEIGSAANFDWRGVDVAKYFAASRVVVESDVRTAAVAEARMGAGAGHRSFVYVTVGTGISFALVVDGAPYSGAHGNALILGAPPVEHLASGAALASLAGVESAEQVFALPQHAELIETAAGHLGRALAWLVNALDPELIVVGGGLGLRDDYRDAATTAMRPHIEAENSRDLGVVAAALGPDAGAIGAALLAADERRVDR